MTLLPIVAAAVSWAVDLEVPADQDPLAWARAWNEVVDSLQDEGLKSSHIAWTREGDTWTLTLLHADQRARVVGLIPAGTHATRVEQLYVAVALLGPARNVGSALEGFLAAPPAPLPPTLPQEQPQPTFPRAPIPRDFDDTVVGTVSRVAPPEPAPRPTQPAPPASEPSSPLSSFPPQRGPMDPGEGVGSLVAVVSGGTDNTNAPFGAVEASWRWKLVGLGGRVALARDANVQSKQGDIGITAVVTSLRVDALAHSEVRVPLRGGLDPFATVGLGVGWRSFAVAGTPTPAGWVPTSVVQVGVETTGALFGIRPTATWIHDFRGIELNLGGGSASLALDRFQIGVGVRLGGRR